MNKKPKIFEEFERLASLVPVPLYWLDTEGVFVGMNNLCLEKTGVASVDVFIGKRYDQAHPKDIAEKIIENLRLVVSSGKSLETEELIRDFTTGENRYFTAIRSPLWDDNGVIVGIIATSIEITDRKKAERLTIENELHKAQLQEQERFRMVAEQVAHDIRSPLTSLSMIVGACKTLPEPERITLRDVAASITDIANNLLIKYKKTGEEIEAEAKLPQHILVSLALSEILSVKKYQYKNLPVKFEPYFAIDSNFVFIHGNPTNFSRMISNLINNAVEAFDGNVGTVSLMLDLDGEAVKVVIQDNGKGIPADVLDKIRNSVAVTYGKKNGSGIGFAQVRSALQAANGNMLIETKVGKGTKITLTFPRAESAKWIVEEIELHKGDIVVILDDDASIHGAWKTRFDPYKMDFCVHNFELGEDAVKFITDLSPEERGTVFLLSDYELINQRLDGLQIISQLKMHKRSILVTSHHNNQNIRELAAKVGVKILPKQLASEIRINLLERRPKKRCQESEKKNGIVSELKKIDLVLVDDDRVLVDSLASFYRNQSLMVDVYYSPKSFLEHVCQYAKDTKICVDNDFGSNQMTGIELAEQLNEAGYTRLYMFTGKDFARDETPGYLTVLLKGNMAAINEIMV